MSSIIRPSARRRLPCPSCLGSESGNRRIPGPLDRSGAFLLAPASSNDSRSPMLSSKRARSCAACPSLSASSRDSAGWKGWIPHRQRHHTGHPLQDHDGLGLARSLGGTPRHWASGPHPPARMLSTSPAATASGDSMLVLTAATFADAAQTYRRYHAANRAPAGFQTRALRVEDLYLLYSRAPPIRPPCATSCAGADPP